MPEMQGVVLSEKAAEQIAKTVREVARRTVNEQPHRARWQHQPSSGGTHRIWFTIISVECVSETETILTVQPTWYTGGCTAAIPDEDSYGYVLVEDVCEILTYYTAAWLVGKTGSATYMYPRSGYCVPKWLVDDICGTPVCR